MIWIVAQIRSKIMHASMHCLHSINHIYISYPKPTTSKRTRLSKLSPSLLDASNDPYEYRHQGDGAKNDSSTVDDDLFDVVVAAGDVSTAVCGVHGVVVSVCRNDRHDV